MGATMFHPNHRSPFAYAGAILSALIVIGLSLTSCSGSPIGAGDSVTVTATPTAGTATPTVTNTPTATAVTGGDMGSILALLPAGVSIMSETTGDLKSDGVMETVVLYGKPVTGTMAFQDVRMAVFEPGPHKAWESDAMIGERAEKLETRDINKDGLPEVLSIQSMGAAGVTLYVMRWNESEYAMLTPHGGYFDGRPSFGDNGVRLEDRNGNGTEEIIACYGPAASVQDIYEWNEGSGGYLYVQTIRLDDQGQVAVEVIGLVLRVSASAMVIDIEPEEGNINAIALLDGTRIERLDGSAARLKDIRPGSHIRAIGRMGASNSLLPSVIIILDPPGA